MKLIEIPVGGDGTPSLFCSETLARVQRSFKKVLLVDDSKFLADTLAMFFQLDGFSARAAYGGAQAMAAYDEDVPDIAFIDLAMPEVDGLAVARHVRSSWRGKPTLLVALTGWDEDPIQREAEGAGFDCFMPKPVDPASIRKFMTDLVCDRLESGDRESTGS